MIHPPSFLTRRLFLKKSCLAGAAFAAAGLCSGFAPLTIPVKPDAQAGGKAGMEQRTRLLMGTIVTLTVLTDSPERAREAMDRAFAEMERLIAVFDRHSGSSALGLLNAHGSLQDSPPELVEVLRAAERLGVTTGNAFNPAVAPVLELLEKARASGSPMPDAADMTEALALSAPGGVHADASALRLERTGMRLTLDGIAKGYIADQASAVLSQAGLTNHMVNAGGDIRASGQPAPDMLWKVGVRHPRHGGEILCTVPLTGNALATSGNYENFFDPARKRHHLVSHRDGESPAIAGVSVRANTAMQADALATAMAMLPPHDAVRHIDATAGASCLIMTTSGHVFSSWLWQGGRRLHSSGPLILPFVLS